MKLLTLNCHSWQEENQIEKIKYLAKVIQEEEYDVIALQEVSQSIGAKNVCGNKKEDNFGFIELITRTPMMVNAGLTRDLINFVIVSLVFFGLNFTLFNFLIKKFNLPARPGVGKLNFLIKKLNNVKFRPKNTNETITKLIKSLVSPAFTIIGVRVISSINPNA